jgi:hypothetical protein
MFPQQTYGDVRGQTTVGRITLIKMHIPRTGSNENFAIVGFKIRHRELPLYLKYTLQTSLYPNQNSVDVQNMHSCMVRCLSSGRRCWSRTWRGGFVQGSRGSRVNGSVGQTGSVRMTRHCPGERQTYGKHVSLESYLKCDRIRDVVTEKGFLHKAL